MQRNFRCKDKESTHYEIMSQLIDATHSPEFWYDCHDTWDCRYGTPCIKCKKKHLEDLEVHIPVWIENKILYNSTDFIWSGIPGTTHPYYGEEGSICVRPKRKYLQCKDVAALVQILILKDLKGGPEEIETKAIEFIFHKDEGIRELAKALFE